MPSEFYPQRFRTFARTFPLILFFLLVGATVIVAFFLHHSAEARARLRFNFIVQRTTESIDGRLETYFTLLRGLRGFIAQNESPHPKALEQYAQQLSIETSYRGIQGIGFARRVIPDDVSTLESEMRTVGNPTFTVWPAGERPALFPIVFLHPPDERNRAAMGYDMFAEPVRRAAMETARDTGTFAATGRVTLVQEIDQDKQAGFLVYLPVYSGADVPEDAEERRRKLLGFAYSPFRADDLLTGIGGEGEDPRVDLEIYDGQVGRSENLLHSTIKFHTPLPEEYEPKFKEEHVLKVAGRDWTIVFSSRPVFDATTESSFAPLVIFFGTFVAALISLLVARRASAEAALIDSELLKSSILDSSLDSIITVDEKGVVIEWNHAAERMFNYTRADALGKSVVDLILPENVRNTLPPYLSQLAGIVEQEIVGKRFEISAMRSNGDVFPAELIMSRVQARPPRYTGFLRDLTEQKRREDAIVESERRFRKLADSAPVLMWMSGPDKEGVYFNRRWLEFTGRTLEEELGEGWLDRIHPDDLTALAECELAFSERRPFAAHFRMLRFDGEYRHMLDTGVPRFTDDGSFEGFIGTCTDITDIKRYEDERTRLLAHERDLRSQAELASRMKDEFLATLSHELRTPLNAILGWSQLIRHGKASEAQLQQGLDIIERNARMQTQIIEDLLDMNRIISGKVRLEVRPVDLSVVVREALETVRPAAEAREISLGSEIASGGETVRGDAQRLQQVLWNLLSNAVKFTPRGGRVTVRLERVASHIELSVSDTGEGISPDFLPYVFDRFRQADASTTRRHGGLGLGLAIVRHIVELHGGQVHVESAGRGQGATFRVQLPLAAVSEPEFREAERVSLQKFGESHPEPPVMLNGVRVLVVDDERDARELIRQVVTGTGAEVVTASSAGEGLDIVKSHPPDVVISDIGMPEVDGFEFLRRLHELSPESERTIPAIALTAFARAEDRERALQAGYHRFLSKPVEVGALVQVLSEVIDTAQLGKP